MSALAQAERIEEIARMLGGAEVTDKFRRAARELIRTRPRLKRRAHSIASRAPAPPSRRGSMAFSYKLSNTLD